MMREHLPLAILLIVLTVFAHLPEDTQLFLGLLCFLVIFSLLWSVMMLAVFRPLIEDFFADDVDSPSDPQ